MAPTKKDQKKPDPQRTGKPTEEQVDMADTVAQRIDKKGTKIEDEAGTGQIDSEGG
jgi:hypothetical protein